jgi:hypothetical protein
MGFMPAIPLTLVEALYGGVDVSACICCCATLGFGVLKDSFDVVVF